MSIREITLRNLLSFGPDSPSLPLHNLNVLIGPNGSGKSNLIEALGLLHAAPTHLAKPVREGGGVRDWLWKGTPGATAAIDMVVDNVKGKPPLRHVIEFAERGQKFELVDERIENAEPHPDKPSNMDFYYRFQRGRPVLNIGGKASREVRLDEVASDESILSQLKDPRQYPEFAHLSGLYSEFRLCREWSFGPHTILRQPQKADQRNDVLESDGANLGLVLNRLRREPDVKERLLKNLRELYGGLEDCDVSVEGGTVQVFFQESGLAIPATRLSDGTLRYLCLLMILCDSKPPPLMCIEEPELGLHPDILPTIAGLLQEASAKTQLVVTTHSDILVDQLTQTPESVVVCEKSEGQTTMKRLDGGKLSRWLEKYRLGELWTKGEIGGARW